MTVIGAMIGEWQTLRAELRQIEEAEHPAITDKYGRVWTWKDKDLYVHDGMAWPESFFNDHASYGLPSARALSNPNYTFCDTCKGI